MLIRAMNQQNPTVTDYGSWIWRTSSWTQKVALDRFYLKKIAKIYEFCENISQDLAQPLDQTTSNSMVPGSCHLKKRWWYCTLLLYLHSLDDHRWCSLGKHLHYEGNVSTTSKSCLRHVAKFRRSEQNNSPNWYIMDVLAQMEQVLIRIHMTNLMRARSRTGLCQNQYDPVPPADI